MKKSIKQLLLFLAILLLVNIHKSNAQNLSEEEVFNKYIQTCKKIYDTAVADTAAYQRLAYLCDTFGNRLSGSESLTKAIDWVENQMQQDGLVNIKKEEVKVPNWKRGTADLQVLKPRHKHLSLLALGGSVPTSEKGITAEVFVVKNKAELFANKEKAKGKIVLFNSEFVSYGETVQYRWNGASWAAECNALAALVRSISPNDMGNPHTGVMGYDEKFEKLPTAAITGADADYLQRCQERGEKIEVFFRINPKFEEDALSYNVMGELRGTIEPEKIIALGGHIDSWDVGTGAQDDGAGIIATWEAVKLLKKMGLAPKHTLRAVCWVNEENGSRGGKQYAAKHKNEEHILLLESDSGIFKPSTIGVSGKDKDFKIMKSIEKLLKLTNPEFQVKKGGGGVDIQPMVEEGYTGCGYDTDDKGKYFWYHHSETDTVDKVDPKDLNESIAAIAIAIYVYSEIYY